ncbi:BlaI/MecI/CopY family transcriptional regulator [Holdemania filiformis]|uniref:BlaI/MecI/CopY family transcriptional regulator n=1 Tax=Holdemania filiformis TaxID=61171 RepID=UPI00242A9587|nr:BlaI/MecI/CopY family transcriptional regulator [Holdemania filiformis]
MKLFDSELKIMDVLWRKGKTPAKEIADELGQSIGWNKNTTYTVIKNVWIRARFCARNPTFNARR